jgi:uncharacterized membrane protein YeaQ/YmgE (transglycosylase-associated protein family)
VINPRVLAWIALGGILGSLARFVVSYAWNPDPMGGFPTGTVVINVIGCLLIGMVVPVLAGHPREEHLRPFIVTGVLNKELFFQSGRELLVVFERLRVVLPGIREAYKDPSYMANLERVGTDFAAYMQSHHPDAYQAFVKRING